MPATDTGHRRTLRSAWVAPIAVSSAVALALVSQPLFASGDANELPDITAEELISRVLDAEPPAMSGTVVHTARLGLPDMLFTEATGADPISLLGGSSTMRVWTDGQERSRVALLGTVSEYSVVANGPELWTYSSSKDQAVHYSLTEADLAELEELTDEARADVLERKAELPTPQEAAEQALAMVNEYSTVEIDAQTTIAGRDVYQVVVTPTSTNTLVRRVALAIDGETMVPLRVQTWSTQDATSPAVEVSFTDVSFAMPSESVFDFSAPASADVREVVLPLPDRDGTLTGTGEKHEKPIVTGEGWESVVEFTDLDFAALISDDPASVTDAGGRIIGSDEAQQMLEEFMPETDGMTLETNELYSQLTTKVPEGRLFSTALLNVLVTDDGRVLAGAVSADALRALA